MRYSITYMFFDDEAKTWIKDVLTVFGLKVALREINTIEDKFDHQFVKMTKYGGK